MRPLSPFLIALSTFCLLYPLCSQKSNQANAVLEALVSPFWIQPCRSGLKASICGQSYIHKLLSYNYFIILFLMWRVSELLKWWLRKLSGTVGLVSLNGGSTQSFFLFWLKSHYWHHPCLYPVSWRWLSTKQFPAILHTHPSATKRAVCSLREEVGKEGDRMKGEGEKVVVVGNKREIWVTACWLLQDVAGLVG